MQQEPVDHQVQDFLRLKPPKNMEEEAVEVLVEAFYVQPLMEILCFELKNLNFYQVNTFLKMMKTILKMKVTLKMGFLFALYR